ncbi:hypothetical protein PIB30_044757, partial [Stylosanthes scabra]|nr:hypothetical protein [Stylosanthes scabra]
NRSTRPAQAPVPHAYVWVTKSQHFQSRSSVLLATLKRNTSSTTSKVLRPGARITRPGVSHPAFRDKLTTAMLRHPVPTSRHASHQNSASRMKTKPRPGAMHLCLGVGKLSSPANPAPRPRPGVLHQRPSVGLQTKS